MLENQQSYQMNTKLNWDKLIAKLGERKCHFVFDEDGRCCNDNDDDDYDDDDDDVRCPGSGRMTARSSLWTTCWCRPTPGWA